MARPKRLIAIAILDGLIAVLSLVAATYLVMNPAISGPLGLSALNFVFAFGLPLLLLTGCVWALSGHRYGGVVLLIASFTYFGKLAYQNFDLFIHLAASEAPESRAGQGKAFAASIRSVIEAGLNAWVLVSARSREYFGRAWNAL